jgi:threonylcarbamoyladenosine tRNA methylthiotransferase MtaB
MMNRLRELFDKPSFTTDIIVGFPQESEKDFLDSVAYMQKCRFMRVHCFSYSQRPGTKGAEMSGQIDNATKSERNRIMTYKSEQVRDSVYSEYIGFEDEALLEQKTADGRFTAYTTRYIPVLVEDHGYKAGDIVKVRLTGIDGGKMMCEVI